MRNETDNLIYTWVPKLDISPRDRTTVVQMLLSGEGKEELLQAENYYDLLKVIGESK